MTTFDVVSELTYQFNRLGIGVEAYPYSGLMASENNSNSVRIYDDYDCVILSKDSAFKFLSKLQKKDKLTLDEAWNILNNLSY